MLKVCLKRALHDLFSLHCWMCFGTGVLEVFFLSLRSLDFGKTIQSLEGARDPGTLNPTCA